MNLGQLEKTNNLDSVIFDLDGTLWDSTKEILVSWNQVLDNHDEVREKLTLDDIKKSMGTPTTKIFQNLFPYLDDEKMKELEKECSKKEIEYIEKHGASLYEGLEDVLIKLSSKYKLFIVSNCQHGYIEVFMKYYGFEKYFIDFEHIGRTGRPKGENIKLVIDRNNLKNSIYVGDTQGDKNAAKFAEIPFVYASYGFGEVDGYDYVIESIVELLNLSDITDTIYLSKNKFIGL